VQIHHIDNDRGNHDSENLAVLCLDCHTETQKKGGFYRRLDAAQVRLYRKEWLNIVGRVHARSSAAMEPGAACTLSREAQEQVAAFLLEQGQFAMLARHYHLVGNHALRDKYTEMALAEADVPCHTEITLRLRQKRLTDVSPKRLAAYLNGPHPEGSAPELAEVHRELGRHTDALMTYCAAILQMLTAGNVFAAAVLLKRLLEENFTSPLLHEAYRASRRKPDLYRRVRCLQELGWEKELKQLLTRHREDIEHGDQGLLKFELYRATGDYDRLNAAYIQLYKELARKQARPPRNQETPISVGSNGDRPLTPAL
jgi:hypothetical protein